MPVICNHAWTELTSILGTNQSSNLYNIAFILVTRGAVPLEFPAETPKMSSLNTLSTHMNHAHAIQCTRMQCTDMVYNALTPTLSSHQHCHHSVFSGRLHHCSKQILSHPQSNMPWCSFLLRLARLSCVLFNNPVASYVASVGTRYHSWWDWVSQVLRNKTKSNTTERNGRSCKYMKAKSAFGITFGTELT